MAWVETRITRTTQPQDAVGIDRSSKFGARVLDGFVGNDRRTELDKSITQYGSLTAAAAPFGVGKKGAGNAGFSFPSDLSAHNGITIVFSYVQHSRASDQVLFEHSVNQNPNAGAFIFYTSAATNRLNFGTSAGNVYDAGYVTAPALGSVATCVVRMRRTSSVVAADDIALWINGVQPAFTSQTVNGATVNFGNYETYFLGRAGTTLRADATIGGYHVLQGFASDAECAELSSNHWQIFEPEVTRLWVDDYVSAGGGATPLTAPLLTNGQTFYGPSISQTGGVQSLTASLLSNTSAFFVPAVTPGAVSATAPLLTNSSTLFAPTISAGGTGLTASLLANSQTFFAPTVAPGLATLTAPLFTNASALYTPAIVNGIVVSPPYFENANSFYSPTVTPGAVALAAALFTNASTVFPARIVVAGDELTQILQILTNRQELNPATGMFVLYDDDGVSVLKTALAWEDAAGTIPYRGQALRRLDALQ